LLREFARWEFVDRQIKDLENHRKGEARRSSEPHVEQVRKLLELKGIGLNSSWLFVMEFFAWRQIKNRRQLGALAGMTPRL
jgi:transposase